MDNDNNKDKDKDEDEDEDEDQNTTTHISPSTSVTVAIKGFVRCPRTPEPVPQFTCTLSPATMTGLTNANGVQTSVIATGGFLGDRWGG